MYSNFDMHYIQKDIIVSLALRSPQRFSELQPARIANNTFTYHLKRLVDNGYVAHDHTGYTVTRKALKTVQFQAPDERVTRSQTPALLTIIYVTNDKGEVLIRKRTKQPFVDYYGLPSGLVHTGETLGAAGKRELKEKTGIVATGDLVYAGLLDFQYLEKESKDIFVHAVASIFTYDYGGRALPSSTRDSLAWSKLTRQNILPEVKAVRDLVANHQPFLSVLFDEPR